MGTAGQPGKQLISPNSVSPPAAGTEDVPEQPGTSVSRQLLRQGASDSFHLHLCLVGFRFAAPGRPGGELLLSGRLANELYRASPDGSFQRCGPPQCSGTQIDDHPAATGTDAVLHEIVDIDLRTSSWNWPDSISWLLFCAVPCFAFTSSSLGCGLLNGRCSRCSVHRAPLPP